MALWLQYGPTRRGIRAFRGASKTFVTIAACLWWLFIDPKEQIMVISKSEKHAKDSLHMARKWIDRTWFLQHMAPRKGCDERDSATQFDIANVHDDRTASFTAFGLKGQITGTRATKIVLDDVETKENTLTVEMREKLRIDVMEPENVLIPGGDVIYLGTDHHEESLYEHLGDSGYEFRSWPIQNPKAGEDLPPDLAPTIVERMERGEVAPGSSMWPERFHDGEIIAREARGRTNWFMQYKLYRGLGNTNLYPLRLSDLIVHTVDPVRAPITISWGKRDHNGPTTVEDLPCMGLGQDRLYRPAMIGQDWEPYRDTKMFIDLAGRGADQTAAAVVSQLAGNLWTHAVKGFEGGVGTECLTRLAKLARQHHVREIVFERNADTLGTFRTLFEPILRAHFLEPGQDPAYPDGWKCSLEEVHNTVQKELRIIAALEPVTSTHRVIVDPSVLMPIDGEESDYALQHQFTRLTKQRRALIHDDKIDAWAGCVKLFDDQLNVDTEDAADAILSRRVQDTIDYHRELAGFGSREPPRMFRHH